MRGLIVACAIESVVLAACAGPHEVASVVAAPSAQAPPSDQTRARKNEGSSREMKKELVARVAGDTEDVWSALFKAMGYASYPAPTVVIFASMTKSACGIVRTAGGPKYCPADRQVYVDTDFFSELAKRTAAAGNFAAAYLLAREVGHHVQNTLGTLLQFEHDISQIDEPRRIELQVRLELQADCYAGVWAFYAQKRDLLEPGDVEEGVPAAQTVGDVSTHGTGVQRMWWFKQGLATGAPRACDTFAILQP